MRFTTGFDIRLKGWLSIQFDGNVHHRPALHETVGRCIRPPPSKVDAHRGARPYNLIGGKRRVKGEGGSYCSRLRKAIAEKGECLVAIASEHGIVDAFHERSISRQCVRHGQLHLTEFAGGIVEVQLVKNTMLPVAGHCRPVLLAESTPLSKKATQIGTFSQFVAVDGVVNVIPTYLVVAITHRHDIDTLARFQPDFPIVLGNTCHHVVMGERPAGTHETVFHPDVVVLFIKMITGNAVLRKNAGVRLAVIMHDVALVVDNVLYGQRRGNHFTGGAKVVEFTTRQGDYGHRKTSQLVISHRWVGAKATSEFRVEVVLLEGRGSNRRAFYGGSGYGAALHQQLDGTVGEKPDANIGEVEVVLEELGKPFDRWFLKHALQYIRCPSVADENPMVLGNRGIKPETIAHHIGIGNSAYALCGTDVHVTTDNHRG